MTAPGAAARPRPDLRPGQQAGGEVTVNVLQGEYRICDDPDVVLQTILGSCVAACIWDDTARVGGINHFILPGEVGPASDNVRFGVNAMELLINGLIKQGARRERLNAKLFGGAKMFLGSANVGQTNVEFARWFLDSENLPCVSSCLGGDKGRKIRFWPTTGRAQRLFMEDQTLSAIDRPPPRPTPRPQTSAPAGDAGDIELF